MDILISTSGETPIYQQITDRIRDQILSGILREGDALPSMRALARDLRISVITTKRAYEELEREGLIVSHPGRGSFVSHGNLDRVREQKRLRIEELFRQVIREGAGYGLSPGELLEIFEQMVRSE